MNAAVEARQLVSVIAGPAEIGGRVKAALGRVVHLTGMSPRRVRGIWNNEARVIRAEELDRLRAVAARLQARKNNDAREHLARELETAAQRLAVVDPTFFRPQIESMRDQARNLRSMVDGQ